MRALAVVIPCLALAAYGCDAPLRPNDLPAPTFTVTPATVAPGDSFAVVFELRNPTSRTMTITSGSGCLFFLGAFRGSDAISVEGLTYFCTASISTFSIPPYHSLRFVQRAVAVERIGGGASVPLPPGEYRIRTMMNAALPDVEATLTVEDASGAT